MGSGDTLDLLRSWHGGDRRALDELIERNLPWVQEYVHRRLGDKLRRMGETLDFVQGAMIGVLEYGPQFEVSDEDQFRALVARIVENELRGQHRYMHRQKRDADRQQQLPSDTVLGLDPPAKSVTRPSERAHKREEEEWVRLALEFLPAQDQEALWLHEWEGLTFKVMGERLGVSEDAARMRFQRALPKLAVKVAQLQQGGLGNLLKEQAG